MHFVTLYLLSLRITTMQFLYSSILNYDETCNRTLSSTVSCVCLGLYLLFSFPELKAASHLLLLAPVAHCSDDMLC